MDKDYINRKIENCEKLIITAISEDQKIIYQEYCDFWTEKLPKKGYEEIECSELEMEYLTKDDSSEENHANTFEIEHAPKKAYYSRGGETHKTKAFKEFLNQKTQ